MNYSKRFVCLAKSRKFSGRCVAGLEVTSSGLGPWLRPISERASEELSVEDLRYKDGSEVQLLDIVEVWLKEPRAHACQTENHVIDDECYWTKIGQMAAKDLVQAAAKPGLLWVNGYSSYNGENDRIPVEQADKLSSSLALVAPNKVVIIVAPGLKKRQVRARFVVEGSQYCLTITDPDLESQFLARSDGEYVSDRQTLICVSIGEPFEGYRYKLAAAVLAI